VTVQDENIVVLVSQSQTMMEGEIRRLRALGATQELEIMIANGVINQVFFKEIFRNWRN